MKYSLACDGEDVRSVPSLLWTLPAGNAGWLFACCTATVQVITEQIEAYKILLSITCNEVLFSDNIMRQYNLYPNRILSVITSGENMKIIECVATRARTLVDIMDLRDFASRVGGILLGAVLVAGGAWAQTGSSRTPSPPGAQIYFETPADGQRIFSPLTVSVGLHGMAVAPAATMIPNTGHHHLLIDTKLGSLNEPLPVSNQVVHLSNGETETTIGLSPGWHTLQLVLADGRHMNFDPPVMSKPIRIFIKRH